MSNPSTQSTVIEAFAPPRGWAVLPAVVVCDPSLSPEARCVLFGIAAHYSDDGGAWPSLARLGAYLGRSRSTVLRALADLERANLVRREHRYSAGQQQTTRYVLQFDRWGGVTHDTPKPRGGVTHDTPRGVMDETPRGVTRDTRTVPDNKTNEQNHPLTPATGGGTVEVEGWVTVEARTRQERSSLAQLLERKTDCAICHQPIKPAIVQHSTGARMVNVRSVGRETATGPMRWRHFWCESVEESSQTGSREFTPEEQAEYFERKRSEFIADLEENLRDAWLEWERTGIRPARFGHSGRHVWMQWMRKKEKTAS